MIATAEAILHTDVTKHNEMVKELTGVKGAITAMQWAFLPFQDLALFYQMNSDTLSLQEMPHEARPTEARSVCSFAESEVRELLQSNRSGLMNGLLHSADAPRLTALEFPVLWQKS